MTNAEEVKTISDDRLIQLCNLHEPISHTEVNALITMIIDLRRKLEESEFTLSEHKRLHKELQDILNPNEPDWKPSLCDLVSIVQGDLDASRAENERIKAGLLALVADFPDAEPIAPTHSAPSAWQYFSILNTKHEFKAQIKDLLTPHASDERKG